MSLTHFCGSLFSSIFHPRLKLKSYRTVEGTPEVNLDVLGKTMIAGMEVEVIDPVEVRFSCSLSISIYLSVYRSIDLDWFIDTWGFLVRKTQNNMKKEWKSDVNSSTYNGL